MLYVMSIMLKEFWKFPGVVSSQGSLLSKTSDGWKDNLKRIKDKSGRGNTIKV